MNVKIRAALIVVSIILAVGGGVMLFSRRQVGKIPTMSAEEMLAYTLKGKEGACITVATVQNGRVEYRMYGPDGVKLPFVRHTYEIGSLTKTFTAGMITQAVEDGKISLDDTIDLYLLL